MPTVFITGVTGFIGRALCHVMLKNGWKVFGSFRGSAVTDLPEAVKLVRIEEIGDHAYLPCDFEGVNVIVHLAGRAHIANSNCADQFEVFRKVNVAGTARLASAAAKAKVKRFIYISSIKVNGEGRQSPYSEEDVPDPIDPYGVTKYEAEQVLAAISGETGMETVILRPPLVYGPGVKANFENLIKMVASGLPLPFKNVNNRRSFIYLGNLTNAILLSAIHLKAANETFMVSDCADVSTPDLIQLIAGAMGKKAALFSLPPVLLKSIAGVTGKGKELDKITGSLFVSSEKIRKSLGWQPPFSLKDGIKETVRCYKS